MKRKQLEVELADMTLEQLYAEDDKYSTREPQGRKEWERLIAERDRAQQAVTDFADRRRGITQTILWKLKKESEKAGKP